MHHFIIYFVGILIYRVGTVYFILFSFTFPFGLPLLPVLTERPHVDLECPSRPLLLGDPPVGLGDVLWVHVLPALLRPCSHLVKEQIQKKSDELRTNKYKDGDRDGTKQIRQLELLSSVDEVQIFS